VQSWNPAAERVFGFTAAEMVGQSITMIIPPDRLGEEDFVLGQVRKGAAVEHFETIRRRKDGTLVDVSLTVSPVRNAAGAIVGASKIARDITERKRFLEIRRSAEHQQQEARRRELEAENRRMQEHSRLKSEFVANMSHELRTPLNAIIGFAELMNRGRGGALSPRHQEYVADILTSARHLLDLINDVLDLAKVESGKLDFRPELVDPAALVREVREIVRGLAAERHLDIEVDAAEVGEVRLDPAKFKQVLYNYVSNAVKFTPEGGRIRIGLLSESATHFRVEVEDTGVGIASADMAKLFVEFQQLDSSASKQYPGTGLGLALTRRIVEAQGGTVGVRSEVGVGSTFFATFPKNVDAFSLVASPRPAAGHA
jgi:PAS domain S-box-containing protein